MFCVGHFRVLKNAVMLYVMTATKIVLPLLVLPYLTRVLTKECYGVVAYVKSLMIFAQVVVDFGFMLSATKDVALAGHDSKKINRILGDVLTARLMLVLVAGGGMLIVAASIPLLKGYLLFTMLNYLVVALTVFLFDFFFRGIEEMSVITTRYAIMRSLSVVLTFFFVKDDHDILTLPFLEIVGSLVAIAFVWLEIRKRGFGLMFSGLRVAFAKLHESLLYFISNAATTTFGALSTFLIGIYLTADQVADWSLCMQMVTVVQMCYSPVCDSLYPHMVKSRDFRFAKQLMVAFMALVAIGCVFTWFSAEFCLTLIGGEKYVTAVPLLRAFIPLLFFSFPAILFGWPMLGALGRVRETTMTTVMTGGVQVLGMVSLGLGGMFTAINMAILRGMTEIFLFVARAICFMRYRRS